MLCLSTKIECVCLWIHTERAQKMIGKGATNLQNWPQFHLRFECHLSTWMSPNWLQKCKRLFSKLNWNAISQSLYLIFCSKLYFRSQQVTAKYWRLHSSSCLRTPDDVYVQNTHSFLVCFPFEVCQGIAQEIGMLLAFCWQIT